MLEMESFKSFNLSFSTLESLKEMDYKEPTEIQKKTIPFILEGEDLVAQAQTGTGKTAAFGIPIVEKIDTFKKEIQALILVPTRELAIQVGDEIRNIGKKKKIFVLTFYGGTPIFKQIDLLNKKLGRVLVGTPGRIKDLIERGYLNLEHVNFLVLDEADRMLDMGFLEDTEEIIFYLPKKRQTLLFSATLTKDVLNLAERYMRPEYKIINVKTDELILNQIKQKIYKVSSRNKFEKLIEILKRYKDTKTLIFVTTKKETESLTESLLNEGFSAQAIHGDFLQRKRERIMRDFKLGKFKLLVSTDVASRGLDIKDLYLVINYGFPRDINSYIHRVGRTGRAGKRGTAITLMTSSEEKIFRKFSYKTKTRLRVENF
jgi:ATP-dependent RNA helicase DeaD